MIPIHPTRPKAFCAHCRWRISDHHLHEETSEMMQDLFRCYCTKCGKMTWIRIREVKRVAQ